MDDKSRRVLKNMAETAAAGSQDPERLAGFAEMIEMYTAWVESGPEGMTKFIESGLIKVVAA
jgi:hypothetical protein